MKISTMRKIDRWVGTPICSVLTVIRKLRDGLWPRRGEPIRRIVFVKLAEQGATVLAYPALRRAIQRVGRENVFFLVFEENRFILDVMELIPEENVIPIKTKTLGSVISGSMSAIRRMRQEKIDAAIDLEFFARSSAIFTFLSGAPIRVGLYSFFGEGPCRGDLMTHRMIFNPHLHTSQTFETMVQAIEIPADQLPTFSHQPPEIDQSLPEFHASPREVEEMQNLLLKEMKRDTRGRLILLNANCSDLLPIRSWPADRYVELARRLLERFPEVYVAFTGDPKEAPSAAKLVEQIANPRCFCLAGKTTLRQLLVLYGMADILITNDSGPAHFASLTPIRVVTLFGPETPDLFAAKTPRNHVLWANLVCSPCVSAYNNRQTPCRDNKCMKNITTDLVFDTVCGIYEKTSGAGN